MKTTTKKKIMAGVSGLLLISAGFAGGLAINKEKVIVQEKPIIVEKPVIVNKTIEVPVEKEVIKTVEVPVEDTEFLKLACNKLMFDDIMECKQEVKAENDALDKALAEINKETKLFDLLEDEGFIVDEDEAELIRIYDDYEEVEIIKSDFDDKEYEFKIKIKVDDKEDDVKKKLLLTIKVEDDEAEIISVEEE